MVSRDCRGGEICSQREDVTMLKAPPSCGTGA
jgi:hypothetical protein